MPVASPCVDSGESIMAVITAMISTAIRLTSSAAELGSGGSRTALVSMLPPNFCHPGGWRMCSPSAVTAPALGLTRYARWWAKGPRLVRGEMNAPEGGTGPSLRGECLARGAESGPVALRQPTGSITHSDRVPRVVTRHLERGSNPAAVRPPRDQVRCFQMPTERRSEGSAARAWRTLRRLIYTV